MMRLLRMICEYEAGMDMVRALGLRKPTWAEYVRTLSAEEAHGVAVGERDTLIGQVQELRRAVRPMTHKLDALLCSLALPLLTACLWVAKFCERRRKRRNGDD